MMHYCLITFCATITYFLLIFLLFACFLHRDLLTYLQIRVLLFSYVFIYLFICMCVFLSAHLLVYL